MLDAALDVPMAGWQQGDTLRYGFEVVDQPSRRGLIACHQDYQLSMSVRYASLFPLQSLPLRLLLQQTDTVGGIEHPIRYVLSQDVQLPMRDALGQPLGETWGSLIELEFPAKCKVRFDSVGMYRFMIIPDFGLGNDVPGIASVGMRLVK